jgi:hypothetical protein
VLRRRAARLGDERVGAEAHLPHAADAVERLFQLSEVGPLRDERLRHRLDVPVVAAGLVDRGGREGADQTLRGRRHHHADHEGAEHPAEHGGLGLQSPARHDGHRGPGPDEHVRAATHQQRGEQHAAERREARPAEEQPDERRIRQPGQAPAEHQHHQAEHQQRRAPEPGPSADLPAGTLERLPPRAPGRHRGTPGEAERHGQGRHDRCAGDARDRRHLQQRPPGPGHRERPDRDASRRAEERGRQALRDAHQHPIPSAHPEQAQAGHAPGAALLGHAARRGGGGQHGQTDREGHEARHDRPEHLRRRDPGGEVAGSRRVQQGQRHDQQRAAEQRDQKGAQRAEAAVVGRAQSKREAQAQGRQHLSPPAPRRACSPGGPGGRRRGCRG